MCDFQAFKGAEVYVFGELLMETSMADMGSRAVENRRLV